MTTPTDRFITLDEEGYFAFDGKRVDDPEYGAELINNLKVTDGWRLVTSLKGQEAVVESFDAPLLARHVRALDADHGEIDVNYGVKKRFAFNTLSTDEWDRFHGITSDGVPFAFTRQGQIELFDQLDRFDDDSVTVRGKRHLVGPWLKPADEVNKSETWSGLYRSGNDGWEQHGEHSALAEILPQLKLSKSKVLVLGCGRGHDAAFLANAGHIVTGVDFSSEALSDATKLYGHIENLSFVQNDAFRLPEAWTGRFDLVFEHTCFCAITPDRRDELVSVWRRVLAPGGRLLGIFFAAEKREGPPFGGSEWELRERLRKAFRFLYWTRWRRSPDRRRGLELVVFAQKI